MIAPLADVTVLDLTRLLPGAYCTSLLAALGATVIKIEAPPDGDYQRDIPPTADGIGVYYRMLNRGKLSVALNLKAPAAVEAFRRLVVNRGDVVVESNRPGVMDRLGLGAARLRAIKPALVYAALSGYGQTGPLRLNAGHDINYLAEAGYLRDGELSGDGVPWADVIGGGLAPALGITALVHHARTTGEGAELDSSLFEGVALLPRSALVDAVVRNYLSAEPDAEVTVAGAPSMPYYGTYRLRDGTVAVGAVEAKFWHTLCEVLGMPEYRDLQLVAERAKEIESRIAGAFAEMSSDEVEAAFRGVDACVSVARSCAEMMSTPTAEARDLLRLEADGFPSVGSPFVINGVRAYANGEPPGLGSDTVRVLAECGFAPDEIDALVQSGAAGSR
jgi:crotonobetainyl-CoA:carnitine CoA-transferase CaiB-like acyl-CoA transferase